MSAVLQSDLLGVEEYLRGEEKSPVRHEYLGGLVFAMAGGSDDHNQIAGGIYAALRAGLRSGPCRAFIENVKLRINTEGNDLFLYPDVMVTCDPRDTDRLYKRFPKLIVEVLSESTERTDRFEKFLTYTKIETLEEYAYVAQDRVEVVIFRRANGWQRESLLKLDDQLRFESVGLKMSLAEVYDGVKL